LLLSESLREEIVYLFSSRFGVSLEFLNQLTFIEQKTGEIWATSAPTTSAVESSRPAGVRALRRMPQGLKPTSVFLRLLADRVRASRVEIDDLNTLRKLLLGQSVSVVVDDGYVAICYRGDVLGCGVCKDGRVRALIAVQKRRQLLECLE